MRVDIGTTTQKYRVIYADPPWKFSSKEAFEPRNGVSGFTPLEAVYPTMTTADLKDASPRRTRPSFYGPPTPTSRTPSTCSRRGVSIM